MELIKLLDVHILLLIWHDCFSVSALYFNIPDHITCCLENGISFIVYSALQCHSFLSHQVFLGGGLKIFEGGGGN